jgi:hypothetical protein
MDAAAPEAAERRKSAEPQAEPRKRPWWRVKIPTSIFVTLIGIALTAWLLPAFTRQWEDRQKATDLKATILDEIGGATANAFAGGDALAHGDGIIYKHNLNPQGRATARAWSVAWFRVDARLRTYFDPRVATMWRDYDEAMRQFLLINEVHGQHRKGQPRPTAVSLDGIYMDDFSRATTCSKGQKLPTPNDLVATEPGSFAGGGLTGLRNALVHCDSLITDAVLAGHARGYSTTTRDLIHDLLPF